MPTLSNLFDLDPEVERLTLLPRLRGSLPSERSVMMPDRYMPDIIAPKILYDFIRAIKAPARAARGEVLDEEEALNVATNVMGGGLAASRTAPTGATLGMFIGPKSAAWNKAAAEKAIQLEKAGVRPQDIWQETMTARGLDKQWRQEIPDVGATLDMSKVPVGQNVRLTSAFSHPALEEAYPNLVNNLRLGKETSDWFRGKFDPLTKTVTTGGAEVAGKSEAENLAQARSTLLHEIQHAIQHHEGWGMGGSTESARPIMQAVKSEQFAPYIKPSAEWEAGLQMVSDANKAQVYRKLSDLMMKDKIPPRSVEGMAPFYEISHQIRSKYGSRPQRAGPDRDRWLQNAAYEIRQHLTSKDQSYELFGTGYTDKQIKSLTRQGSRLMEKNKEAVREFQGVRNKFQKLKGMTDEELYRRLAGEAESRLTQTREGLSQGSRQANFPFAEKKAIEREGQQDWENYFGLDVPAGETIPYRPFSQSYDDPLMQFLIGSSSDPLEKFVGLQGK